MLNVYCLGSVRLFADVKRSRAFFAGLLKLPTISERDSATPRSPSIIRPTAIASASGRKDEQAQVWREAPDRKAEEFEWLRSGDGLTEDCDTGELKTANDIANRGSVWFASTLDPGDNAPAKEQEE